MKMKWKELQKRCLILGAIFLFAGTGIGIAGFGMAHFDISYLREETKPKWYRTIHLGDHGLALGVRIGNAYITGLGAFDF